MNKVLFLVLLCLLLPFRVEALTGPQISVGDRFIYTQNQLIQEFDTEGRLLGETSVSFTDYDISITEITDEEVKFILNSGTNDQSIDYDCLGNIFTSPDWSYWAEHLEEQYVVCEFSSFQRSLSFLSLDNDRIFAYGFLSTLPDGNTASIEKTRDYTDRGILESRIDETTVNYVDRTTIDSFSFSLTFSDIQEYQPNSTVRISGFQILFVVPILMIRRRK